MACSNNIEIYQNNSKTIIVTISGLTSLSGYTCVLSVREKLGLGAVVIQSTGVTIDLVSTFELLPADTNIDTGAYQYDVVVYSSTNNYTAIQAQLTIKDSVLYT